MYEENACIRYNSSVIIDLLDIQNKTHTHGDNPLSTSIGIIPPTISSLIPPSPYRHHIQIGPLHKDRYITNNVKAKYMNDLFQRLQSGPDEIVTECMNWVYANIESIRAYYDRNGTDLDDLYFDNHHLPHIMVLDACYILELIYKWSENKKSKGNLLDVKYDLVGLHNQIPFFVLQHIFECTLFKLIKPSPTPSFLPNLILAFLKDITPFEPNNLVIADDDDTKDYKHILDLVYQCYKPQDASSSDLLSHVTTIFSARELAKAGVKFNPNQGDKGKIEMKFRSSWCNATLTMPPMRIEGSTAHLLCNLAAYERAFPEVGNYITSYVFAMKMLLDTKEDLLKLLESNICRNPTGHQYVVDLIHGLCKDVALTDFLYAKEWHKMGKYCNSRLGWTRRTYFSGAWSYIASISGLILFVLTVIQTYSSIRTL